MRTRPWDSRALLALGLLIFLAPGSVPADDIRPAVGHRAPDFALHDLNDRAKAVLSCAIGSRVEGGHAIPGGGTSRDVPHRSARRDPGS